MVPPPPLRAVLEGLLEDQLLDDPPALHFALAPGAANDGKTWVAVCDKAWLRSGLQALEAAGMAVARIVPERVPAAPGDTPDTASGSLHEIGRAHV